MKKIFIIGGTLFIFVLSWHLATEHNVVQADWWERPSERPTQPAVTRTVDSPTVKPSPSQVVPSQPVSPTATTAPENPTLTPSSGGGGTGGTTDGGSGSSSGNEDPCGSGKSFTGPYCGWSPKVEGQSQSSTAVATAPKVKGLSRTSSGELVPSDIILLIGVLCLLLYVRSKADLKRAN